MSKHRSPRLGGATCRIFILTAFIILLSIPAQAHPPANVSLSFDQENKTLNVSITHTVSNPSGHYVARVDIAKNGQTVQSEDYTGQPTSSQFTYSYPINAPGGDVLTATAICSIAGSRKGELTVPAA